MSDEIALNLFVYECPYRSIIYYNEIPVDSVM